MQFSIPPTFFMVEPFSEIDSGLKPISITEIVQLIADELKNTQKEVIKLVDTYQTIHCRLLKNALNVRPRAINSKIEEQIIAMYDIRTVSYTFPLNVEWSCRQMIEAYYIDHLKEIYHMLPTPSKLLMSTDLDSIEGDINIEIDEKRYYFFLCSPFKYLYLQKRDKNLYYKFVTMQYEQYNMAESDGSFL